MDLKQVIEKYIQETGLISKVKEKNIKIDDICDYVNKCAEKELNSKSGCIEDKVVYGWVVHFVEDEKDEIEKQEKEAVKEKLEDTTQLSLFGGDL